MTHVLLAVVLLLAVLLTARFVVRKTVVPEGHAGLLYTQGRYERTLSAGLYWLWRATQHVELVDLRLRSLTVPGQEVLCRDQVTLKVSVAVRYAVVAPDVAHHRVQSYTDHLYLAVQLALRTEAGQHPLEELISGRVALSEGLLARVAEQARGIGLAVEAVELKDVMLPAELRRAFAEALKARKEGLATLEKARGETAALRSLANAARMVEQSPALLQLRTLQTLGSASTTPGNTFVVGMGPHLSLLGRRRSAAGPTEPAPEGEPAAE
ncbi:slipin family protein [Hyalangium sp.]|uniref:slipin family protein n=1 Tax=Hyalangium sp. TaxID=2028555 RepID=UPI002D262907|nr:slipin family protein [Hyalangium sp.]HYH96804.1 slipin family protein [Hyalangium sp.]